MYRESMGQRLKPALKTAKTDWQGRKNCIVFLDNSRNFQEKSSYGAI